MRAAAGSSAVDEGGEAYDTHEVMHESQADLIMTTYNRRSRFEQAFLNGDGCDAKDDHGFIENARAELSRVRRT